MSVGDGQGRFMVDSPCVERLQSARVFPELQSQTYSELIEEADTLMEALKENTDLQKEFVSVLQQPHRDLLGLSNELYAVKHKLETQEEVKTTDQVKFSKLMDKLSAQSAQSEVTALIIVTEASKELMPVSLDYIIKAASEEISNLFSLFRQIPISSSAHNFSKPPFCETDPTFCHLLSRIGFTNWRGNLIYEIKRGFCGLDMITLTIIIIRSLKTQF